MHRHKMNLLKAATEQQTYVVRSRALNKSEPLDTHCVAERRMAETASPCANDDHEVTNGRIHIAPAILDEPPFEMIAGALSQLAASQSISSRPSRSGTRHRQLKEHLDRKACWGLAL